jgi:hypothetical protein
MDVDEGSMETTSQLFLIPPPLLDWLPEEPLFSLASRNHYLWGSGQDWETCMVLFGCDRAGTQHDLPNHLWEFERRTLGRLGKAETIACKRTLLCYYRKFLSGEEEQEVTRRNPQRAAWFEAVRPTSCTASSASCGVVGSHSPLVRHEPSGRPTSLST